MADSVMFDINPSFEMRAFAEKMAETYRMKGYTVSVANLKNSCIITFDKGTGGINMILGLGEGIKATCMVSNNMLSISFSDGDWTGKIIALVAGWFLCLIPLFTGIIGITKQLKLPKSIGNDATMIASEM